MLSIEEIISQFKSEEKQVSRQTLKDAIRQKEAITPHLLAILEDLNEHPNYYLKREEDVSYFFALYLLAQFREPLAYPLIVDFVSKSPNLVEDLLGDTMTEDLDKILASVGSSNPNLVKSLIDNPDVNQYVRKAALRTWVIWVAYDYLSREEALDYFRQLFAENKLQDNDWVMGGLVVACCQIGPHELMKEIEEAFENELVDTWLIRKKDVDEANKQTVNRTLALLKKDQRIRLIDDAIEETKGWLWQPQENPQPKVKAESMDEVKDFTALVKSKSSQKKSRENKSKKGFGR